MAERRMFTKKITESDAFLDMPSSTQMLYFHFSMNADDDGFVNNANRIRRVVGATQEDYQTLFDRGYLIQMSNGLVVVAHWRICNTIRKDRRKPTVYQSEYKKLKICDNVYTLDSKGEKQTQPVTSIPQEKTVQKSEEFWKAYPRKEHRALTEQEYSILIMQGISEDMLIASAKAYAKDKQDTEPKYLNCPDTWLHKGIYADYEVKEKKPEPEVTEPEDDEPGINLWDSKEE